MRGLERRRPKPRLVSVVVPVLNNEETLPTQLDALLTQNYKDPYEIVVADNGSQDGSKRIASEKSLTSNHLRVVDASTRRGVNFARNAGTKAAGGDLIAFCDGDDLVSKTWLSHLVDHAIDCDAVAGSLDVDLLNDQVVTQWRSPLQKDRLPMSLNFLPYGVSANLAVWADALSEVGGWDEDFIVGGSEVDLSWRLQLRSHKLCFAPEAVVHYRLRDSMNGLFRQGMRYGRGDVQLYRKYRDHGIDPSGFRPGMAEWKQLLRLAPGMLRSPAGRGRWLFKVAFRIGRVWGSFKYRTLLL